MEEFTAYTIDCEPEFVEILMAEMGELSFDTFEEHENGFVAYALTGSVGDQDFMNIVDRYCEVAKIKFTKALVKKENWNQQWETNYEPIVVEDKCLVRAGFHAGQSQYPYEIVINPKMSFGTGHHETTYLMLAGQLEMDHLNKSVLDAGCGTGILSIMAGKLGAKKVIAFDNDKWVIDNVKENIKINKQRVEVICGTMSELKFEQFFDIILANINKNVLLENMENFVANLHKNGDLLLSGFYVDDLTAIIESAENAGLTFIKSDNRNNWCRANFKNIGA